MESLAEVGLKEGGKVRRHFDYRDSIMFSYGVLCAPPHYWYLFKLSSFSGKSLAALAAIAYLLRRLAGIPHEVHQGKLGSPSGGPELIVRN